jgi:hypothetical protein
MRNFYRYDPPIFILSVLLIIGGATSWTLIFLFYHTLPEGFNFIASTLSGVLFGFGIMSMFLLYGNYKADN